MGIDMSTSPNLETSKSLPVKALCADENIDEYVFQFVDMLTKQGFSVIEKKISDEFVKVKTLLNIDGYDILIGFLMSRGTCRLSIIYKFREKYHVEYVYSRDKPLIEVINETKEKAKLMIKQILNIEEYNEELFYCHDKVDAEYDEETNELILKISLPITKEDIKELKSCLEEIFIGEQQ